MEEPNTRKASMSSQPLQVCLTLPQLAASRVALVSACDVLVRRAVLLSELGDMTQLTQHYCDSAVCIHYWYNVAIVDIAADVDVERMKVIGNAYRTLAKSHPGGVAPLVMVRHGTPVASAPARAEAARFTRELGDALLRVSMVVEGSGVIVQLLRSVVRGVNMVTRSSRITMFESIDEATQAMVPLLAAPGEVDPLKALRESVRRARSAFLSEQQTGPSDGKWY